METRLYPVEYIETLTQLAAAGQSLAHALNRRTQDDPAIITLLSIHKDRTEKHDTAYRHVIAENLHAELAGEAAVEAVNRELNGAKL